MADNGRMTRQTRRHQSAYEDRARDIQKRIDACREAFRDARDFIQDERFHANDSQQRKTQLVNQYRANIMQLNQHAANLDAARQEWIALMQANNIAHEDSDWAESMRRQHDQHFAQAPNLDFDLRALIAIYRANIDRAQQPADLPPSPELGRGLQPTLLEPVRQVQETAARHDARDSDERDGDNGANPAETAEPADIAGAERPREAPSGDDSDASSSESSASQTPRRRVRIRDTPTEIPPIEKLSVQDEYRESDEEYYEAPPAPPLRRILKTSTPQQPGRNNPETSRQRDAPRTRSSAYGLFTQADRVVTDATTMAWHNTPPGTTQRDDDFFYASSPAPARNRNSQRTARDEEYRRSPLYLASLSATNAAPDRVADLATGTTGEDTRRRRQSSQTAQQKPSAADAETRRVHRERLQHVLRDAKPPPAGRGRSDDPDSASATFAPRGRTTADHHRSPCPKTDYGADFGPENASKFYRNGTHLRVTSTKPSPLVLKELPIPKFNGDYRSYPMFRSRFLKTVGERTDLDPCDKFQFLMQHLDGEPLRMANRFVITDGNYYKCLDRLEERYGDNATLVTLLAQDFQKLKSVGLNSRDLIRFYDEASHLTDQMEQLGQDVDNNHLWRHTLLSKMPLSLRTKIAENMGKDPMTTPIQEILTRIFEYARLLEKSEAFNPLNVAERNSGRGDLPCRPDPRSTSYRAGTYTTEADVTHAANEKNCRCVYCGRYHWASKCDIYDTISLRTRRLRQLDLCFLCLRGGHWTGTCPKRTNDACRYCHRGQHHQSICRQAYPGLRRPAASLRASPVRANNSGMPHGSILKNEPHGSSSSKQVSWDPTSVTRDGAQEAPPATNSRPPSTQISSKPGGKSNSSHFRRRKSKGPRTDPSGRHDTTRPTTAYVDENVTQMGANACGGDGLLLDHQHHLTTDRRSTPAEARWDDRTHGGGSGGLHGIPDISVECVSSDEEASLPDSTGHCSDADSEPPVEEQCADDPSWFAANPDFQQYSGYAVSASSPADNHAVLLECLQTTAVNTSNGVSRPVIVFFDSGSNCTYISMKMALELRLPCLEKRFMRVNTFGTDVITTIESFATTVLLRSPQGASVALTLTASDRIVPPVTTALVSDDEVQLLRKNECAMISTREKPDLLIGQDLFHLFDRRLGPRLPNGFHVTWTCLGPVASGAGKVASHRKDGSSTTVAVNSDPELLEDPPSPVPQPPTDTSTTSPPSAPGQHQMPTPSLGYNPDDPLNLWTLEDDPPPAPTYLVGPEARETTSDPTYLVGAERGDSTVADASTHLCTLAADCDADLFGDFSRVENAGIGTSEMTPDDQAAADMLKKIHKRHSDGRYEVPLLFRTPDGEPPSNTELPTNEGLAKGRCFSTRKMLFPHPKKLLDYHSVILDWRERGFIKEAPKTTAHTKHTLSHHPVFKETSTTTATRPVYDASAKLPGRTALNDWLYRGPITLPEIPGILLRSRPPKIVILADISKAFLQMEVKESHKDCLSFYWFRDPFKEPTDDNLIEYRFERVPFGLKSAPYLLAGVIQLHLESVGTPLALELLKNCYVDNVLLTADTVNEALAKYREAKEIFAQIGMPLREFASNSAEFNAAVDPADRADLTKLKELGIRWDILSDYWDIPLMPKQPVPPTYLVGAQTCLAASPATRESPTYLVGTPKSGHKAQKKRKGRKKTDNGILSKRGMLRLVARIFDPQGLAQAATLLAKLAIQEAWKAEKDWDDEITGDIADLWKEAIKDFDKTVIRVPRRIAKGKIKSVEIHVFTDGSSYAYGFTAYLRVKNADGTYSTNLVYARARVKPIKDAEKFTIPRMELLGVLLGVRIAAYLHKELLIPITATYLWSDSTIVLHQIANSETLKEVWNENRLKEFRLLRDTLKIQFRYVPTDANPADIVSRGLPAAELQKCEMWWYGAPFLALDSSRWPEQPTTLRTRPSPSDQPTELNGSTAFTTLFLGPSFKRKRAQWIRKRSQRKKPSPLDTIAEPLPSTRVHILAVMAMADAAIHVAKPPPLPAEPILPRAMEEKYDRWPRLVRIQYYVVRFAAAALRHLRTKNQRRYASALGFDLGQCFITLGRKPTLRDLQLVTMIILRKTQLRHPPSDADRRNLGIFESQGLLYVKGRLGNMKLRPTALTPLFLPREARDTELIILEYHRINGHAGVTVTLANLRMRYWFTKGRVTIRNVLRKYCFACRRESMHPFAVPPWPQLPTSRVTNARPFFFTGLDFFGPIYLRAPNGSGTYYTSKYYVCIFVCMTLRCVHLELCDDLSTDAFLHAFKRFGYRREFPRRILSDNGLSFITAREVINRIRGRPAHQQAVKRTLPVRKAVSARLAARRMAAPADSLMAADTQQPRPTYLVGRRQQRGAPTYLVGPSTVLATRGHRLPPPVAALTRDEEKLVDFCQRHNIEWQTITELSPWKGGVYERLIGLIKHCLRRSIGNTKPTVVEFLSLLFLRGTYGQLPPVILRGGQ
ncbi:Pao retrotransposon peptidase family protein [Aphelenchoides avenae]|nr:Pao retrotransposon peptidase family protein [Aphelenchus avenae]